MALPSKDFSQYSFSGIYYEDDAISVENVKEVVKKELEGPERSSLRIQLFLLAPHR